MARMFRFAEGEFYHIYNRGVEKRDIFLDKTDYDRFISLLYVCNSNRPVHLQIQGRTLNEIISVERGEPLLSVVAYCLMPNHFHLLIREIREAGCSSFIQKLSTGYTMYFNKKHERSGALFQGKFKATHASEDNYLKYLLSYIHLNPVKLLQSDWKETGIRDLSKTTDYLDSFTYSSYLCYKNVHRPENNIIDKETYPFTFSSIKELEEEMQDWLTFKVEP